VKKETVNSVSLIAKAELSMAALVK